MRLKAQKWLALRFCLRFCRVSVMISETNEAALIAPLLVSLTHTPEDTMDGDYCSPEGARRLKLKIEDYWRERGYDVEVSLIDAGFVPAMRSARVDVRSDMKNGMPRRRAAQEAAPQRIYAEAA
jgi:hypothetical protein